MMTKEAMITIRGLQNVGGESQDPIETVIAGQHSLEDGVHILRYEEPSEQDGTMIYSELSLQPGRVEVKKQGAVNTVMLFEEDKTNLTHYETSFGTLLLGVAAGKMEWIEENSHIKVAVPYNLEADCIPVAQCHIAIEVQIK